MFSTAALSLHTFSITNYIMSPLISVFSQAESFKKHFIVFFTGLPILTNHQILQILHTYKSYCSVDIFHFNLLNLILFPKSEGVFGHNGEESEREKFIFLFTLIFTPCRCVWVLRIPSKLLILSLYKLCVTIFYVFHNRFRIIKHDSL